MSWLHATTCQRQCGGSFATKLSRLDAREGMKIVHCCRTQASSHSSQSVVDGRVSEAGVRTGAPGRGAAAYSAVDWSRANVAVCNFVVPASQPKPESRLGSATRDVNLL